MTEVSEDFANGLCIFYRNILMGEIEGDEVRVRLQAGE